MDAELSQYIEVAQKWSLQHTPVSAQAAACLIHQLCDEVARLEATNSEHMATCGRNSHQQWIPVGKQLPPLMTEVLGWHPADRVRAWFRHSGTVKGGPREGVYWEQWSPQDRECDDCEVDEPTHWMLLPEPPEVA